MHNYTLQWQKVNSVCWFATYYIDGFPTSCVVIILTSSLFNMFSLCISDINTGEKLVRDFTISRTFVVTSEAIFYGFHGIALLRENDIGSMCAETWG